MLERYDHRGVLHRAAIVGVQDDPLLIEAVCPTRLGEQRGGQVGRFESVACDTPTSWAKQVALTADGPTAARARWDYGSDVSCALSSFPSKPRAFVFMRILLINHYASSKLHGNLARHFYLAKNWVLAGHTVQIVAASYTHLRARNPQVLSSTATETIDGVNYFWVNTPKYQGNGIRRIMNMLSFTWSLFRYSKRLIAFRPDLVIVSSPNPLNIYPAAWIAKRSRARLIFEVRDIWPLTPVLLAGYPTWHPFILLLQRAERDAYRWSDKVVSLLDGALPHMVGQGMRPDKFLYVPNGVDREEWSKCDDPVGSVHLEMIRQLKRSGHFIVGYAGNICLSDNLEVLILAARHVAKHNVAILLVGQGPEESSLHELCEREEIRNVFFLPPIPKTKIPSLLSYFDACYLGWRDSPLYQLGISANKLFDYMAAGKPVINAFSGGRNAVDIADCGLTIRPEDPAAIAEAILRIARMEPTERNRLGSQGRRYVWDQHDYAVLATKFLDGVMPATGASPGAT